MIPPIWTGRRGNRLALVLWLALVPLLAACDEIAGPCPENAAPEPIRLSPIETTVTVGDTVDFDVVNEYYRDEDVDFEVVVDSIAAIDTLGRAVATAVGTTEVYVPAASVPTDCAVSPRLSYLRVAR